MQLTADALFERTLQQIDAAIERGEDIWEMVGDAANANEGSIDAKRWNQCDLAARVAKRYGGDAIGEWAKRANIPKNRAKEYRTVGTFYCDRSARADFLELNPTVTYSHMRVAARVRVDMKAITDKDRERAYGVLRFGSSRSWSSDQTERFVGRWRNRTGLSKRRPTHDPRLTEIGTQDMRVGDFRQFPQWDEQLADRPDDEVITVMLLGRQ